MDFRIWSGELMEEVLHRIYRSLSFLLVLNFCPQSSAMGGLNFGAFWQNPNQPLFTTQLGQAPNATPASTQAFATVFDGSGNIYVAGYTNANLSSCNGVSSACSGSSQGIYDYQVSKYNSSGSWQWTRQLGETGKNTFGEALAVDLSGNVYIAGYTNGNLPSCSGVSSACSGSSQGTQDYFISQYSSSGTWQWTKQLGEAGFNSLAYGVAVDASGNVSVAGVTTGNLSSCSGVSSSCSGSAQGVQDYFVSQYSSSGAWQWTKQLGETGKSARSAALTVDSSGNINVAGYTTGNLPSCSGVSASCSGNAQGSYDYFVSQYNSSGAWQWTKQLGQTGKSTRTGGTAVDSSGNVYISGYTNANLPSCSGVSTSCSGSSQGTLDYFVSKYNSSGTWQWTKQLGQSSMTSFSYGLSSDSSGNVYVTGSSTGNLASCGGVSTSCSGSAQGTADYYVSKYNSTGVWQWTKQLGGTGQNATANAVAVQSGGTTIAVAGNTTGNLTSCGGISSSCTGPSQGAADYFVSAYNSSGTWQWTQELGQGGTATYGAASAIDSNGNIYVTGYTNANLPSCGGISSSCSGNSRGTDDYFVSKYNSSGTWQWTIQLGETGKSTLGQGLAVDLSGNVYIAGFTTGNLPSCGGVSSACSGSSQGSQDYFISKYNSSGTWVWTQQLGQTSTNSFAQALAVDSSGNVYIAGYTSGNLPSCSGVSGAGSGTAQGFYDYYLSKYNSSGAWQWTKQLGESAKSTYLQALAVDSSANLYVSGYTNANLASCGGVSASCSGSAQGTQDYFVSKYNSSGTWQWTKQLGETGTTTSGAALSVGSTNVYVVGTTSGNLPSCSGVSTSCSGSSQGTQDYFVSDYNSSGTWQWTKQLGETGTSTIGQALAVDSNTNLYVSGYTSGNIPSCGGVSTSCSGSAKGTQDYFMSKYNSSGTWQWTKQLGETGTTTVGQSLTVDSNANVFVTGYTSGNISSCNGAANYCTGASSGYKDFLLLKYRKW